MSCPTTSHLIPSLSLSLELFSTEAAWPESPWAPSLGMGTRDQNSDLPACVAEIPAHWAISPAQSSPYSLNAPGGLSFTLEIADNRHTPPFFWWLSLGSSVISRGRLFFWTQYGHLLGFFRLIILVLQKMNWLPSCQDGLPFSWLQATGQSKMDQEDEIALNKKHLIEEMVSRERQARVSVNPISKWEVNVFKVTISHQVSLRLFINLLILIQNSSLEAEGGLFFLSLDKAVLKRLWVNIQNELWKEVWRQRVSD